MDAETINVIVEGKKIEIPSKFTTVSDYMHSLLSLGFEDDEQIQIQRVSQQTFKQILEFYTLNDFQEVPIKHPIKDNDLQNYITVKNATFIKNHSIDSVQFKNLYKSAQFLGCRNLQKVCAARFACYLYFADSKQAFQAKLKQLGIAFKIQFEDNEKFKKLYPFMNK